MNDDDPRAIGECRAAMRGEFGKDGGEFQPGVLSVRLVAWGEGIQGRGRGSSKERIRY